MGENSAAAFFSLFFGVIIGAEPQVKHSQSQRERFHCLDNSRLFHIALCHRIMRSPSECAIPIWRIVGLIVPNDALLAQWPIVEVREEMSQRASFCRLEKHNFVHTMQKAGDAVIIFTGQSAIIMLVF
jgi:hypothetical protein